MSIVIDGKGVPLRVIMRNKLYEAPGFDVVELQQQLRDAAQNASHPGRRKQYGEWADTLITWAVEHLDLDGVQ